MKAKTVIVTGASTGIGKETARLFIEKGSNVVMNSQNEANLRAAFEEFGSPESAVLVSGDIAERSTSEKLVSTAFENFGSLDVLVNNAGVFQPKPFLDVEESDVERFYKTNLIGTYFTSQTAARRMIENGNGGSIINVGSVLVDHAIAGFPASAPIAIKGAIHSLSIQLASELAEHKIRVNTVAPGVIRSGLQAKIGIDDVDAFGGLHLLNRVGESREVAEGIYYLATADFVTGELLNIDGGHVAGHKFG